ncbi:MAG: hypothetical protein WBR26_13820 [Candidatus Acidiferrum sp.]
MRVKWLGFVAWLLVTPIVLAQQTPPPVLFFSDLTQGPASGNSDTTYNTNGGVYVTLYGNFLNPPTITLNGASCLTIVSQPSAWLWYQRIVVQLNSTCTSGNFVVTTSSGASNGLPFSVASGQIYFVSNSGNDSNGGSFASPWKTIPAAVQTAGSQAGSIVYLENGVSATADDGQGWSAALTMRTQWCQGTPNSPTALVAYPGASVQIGPSSPATSPGYGLRGTDSTAGGGPCGGNWTIAEINLRGVEPVLVGGGTNWRWVGNDLTNPQGTNTGQDGAFETSQTTSTLFYGNNAHDLNGASNDSETQGVYFSTDSDGVDMGWNRVYNVTGCRGVQIHSSPIGANTGLPMYNISIHDNEVHDTICDGIIVDTIGPSQGPVTVYNNVVYNAGTGPQNPDGGGIFSCINVQNTGDNNGTGSGTVEVFNNSTFSCGTNPTAADALEDADLMNNCETPDPNLFMHIRNNLAYSVTTSVWPSGVPYFGPGCNAGQLYGTNNLAYGAGVPTAILSITGTLNLNPGIVSTSTPDLHLTSVSSPAVRAGTNISVTPYGVNWTGHDHDGLVRPSPRSIGAYEFASPQGATGAPNPPTDLTVVAH